MQTFEDVFKGVDDFLEVTIVDKGDKDEKKKIGRFKIFPIIFLNIPNLFYVIKFPTILWRPQTF